MCVRMWCDTSAEFVALLLIHSPFLESNFLCKHTKAVTYFSLESPTVVRMDCFEPIKNKSKRHPASICSPLLENIKVAEDFFWSKPGSLL